MTRMTLSGAKTAVSSLISHSFSVKQLRFGDTSESGNKGTTHWENGNVMAQHEFDTTLYANYVQKWTAALT